MHSPLVSVVLPVYNGAKYLDETIESILTQFYQSLELIVVDDGSIDESGKIITTHKSIHYIYQQNQGVPFARNAGADVANGEFLCFVDQDDTWLPEKTRLQVEAFNQRPDLGYCITHQLFYLSAGVDRPEWCPEDWLDRPLAGFSPSTLMIRKSLFDEMGRFDTNLPTGSDTDFFFRLKDDMVPFLQLDEILVRKRVHMQNQSAAHEAVRRDIMETVRRSIHRQRKQHNQS